MLGTDTLRSIKAIVRNGVIWGAGWTVLAFLTMRGGRLTGMMQPFWWVNDLGMAVRIGVLGGVVGAAFAAFIRIAYRGRRLAEINWVRFGVVGGVLAGVFVPVLFQSLNLLSGELVPLKYIIDDIAYCAVFGGLMAAGSMKLAQIAEASTGDESLTIDDPSGEALRAGGSPAVGTATRPLQHERRPGGE